MTDLDTLVRDALDLQASRAPQSDAVRARLETRLRTRPRAVRTTRLLVPAAAAVAAVGVVAAGAVLRAPAPWSPAPADGSATSAVAPAATTSAPASGYRPIPLRFSPTSLPAGLRMVRRSFEPDGVRQTWAPEPHAFDGSGWPAGRLEFYVMGPTPDDVGSPAPKTVQVAGRPGRLVVGGDKILLQWQLAPRTWVGLVAAGLPIDAKGVLAIAASVRPDDRSVVFPLDTGHTPNEITARVIDGTGRDRWVMTEAIAGATVAVGTEPAYQMPKARHLPSTPLVVRGRPARFIPVSADHPYAELVVTVQNNRFLTVAVSADDGSAQQQSRAQPPATQAGVVAIAERVRWSEPSFD